MSKKKKKVGKFDAVWKEWCEGSGIFMVAVVVACFLAIAVNSVLAIFMWWNGI